MIVKISSGRPGPTVAIFGGMHGDERVGVEIVAYLRSRLRIDAGTVYLVNANPHAIAREVRFTEKNLNRCFTSASCKGTTYEERRATELMSLLDTCDALLDLHAYNEDPEHAVVFAITEGVGLPLAHEFGVHAVVTNITAVAEGGANSYMLEQGKVGIAVELGARSAPRTFFPQGIAIAHQFLAHFGLIAPRARQQRYALLTLRVASVHRRRHEAFAFTQTFRTFDTVCAGTHICTDGLTTLWAPYDLHILFPRANPVGVEACILALEC